MTDSTRIPLKKLPPFNKIERNTIVYKGLKLGVESMECQCYELSLNCGTSKCLNRGSQMECPDNCRVGVNCANQKLQKKSYPKLGASWTKEKGYGILADEYIDKGRLVNEYVGEIISIAEASRRSSKYKQSKQRHHYIMGIGNGEAIDATNQGNLSRFINHSCEPNCVVEKWIVNSETRAGIFARRDIAEGEEVTIDYAFEEFGSFLQKCLCGEKNCSGFIGGLSKKRKSNGDIVQLTTSRISSLPKIPKKIAKLQPLKIEVQALTPEPVQPSAEDRQAEESFENSGFEVYGKQAAREVSANRVLQPDEPIRRSVKRLHSRHYLHRCPLSPIRSSSSKSLVLHHQEAARHKANSPSKNVTKCNFLSPKNEEVLVPLPQLEDVLVPPPPPSELQLLLTSLNCTQLEDVLVPPSPPKTKPSMMLLNMTSLIPLPK